MPRIILLLTLLFSSFSYSQVGIGTTTPKSSLDITVSDSANPTNTDGLLIPRIDVFPAINPTINQQGMLVYLTTTFGVNASGFYYWDNATTSWINAGGGVFEYANNLVKPINSVNEATSDFIFGSSQLDDDGNSNHDNRFFFDKSKAAFRAGMVNNTIWDNAKRGDFSAAFGKYSEASGEGAMAWGVDGTAKGDYATAFGGGGMAEGDYSTAWGSTSVYGNFGTGWGGFNSSDGDYATVWGQNNATYGNHSTAFGINNSARSAYETILGVYSTTMAANSTTSWNANDRLFTIGNGTSNGTRSNALTIYKDGKMNINDAYNMPLTDGSVGQVMTTDGSGVVSWGTGSGLFEVVSNVVRPNSTVNKTTDDFVFGSPQLDYNGNFDHRDRMFFDKSKGAFRVGRTTATNWNDINVGNYSFASGYNTTSSGEASSAWGYQTKATSFASTVWGFQTEALEDSSTTWGISSVSSGEGATAWGFHTIASGPFSTTFGYDTTALTYLETVLGAWNTSYTPASTSTWNANDRLFTIGNGTSSSTRSNALTIYKDGKMNINDAYDMPIVDGTSGQALTTDGAGNVTWGTPSNTGAFEVVSGVVKPNSTVDTTTDDFVFGSSQLDQVSNNTFEKRMFFNKPKGAFRAGVTYQDEWNDSNIGSYSFATGYLTKASGTKSVAFGHGTEATSDGATAWGWNSNATGDYCTAFGYLSNATGLISTAWGNKSVSSGVNTTAWGDNSSALSYSETALGTYNTSYSPVSALSWEASDRLFIIGNGTSSSTKSDALIVLKNGTITAPSLDVSEITDDKSLVTKEYVDVEAETTSIAFEASWGQYGGTWEKVTYYKDRDRVYIDGLALKSTTIGTNDHVFTLPVGYRPALNVIVTGQQDGTALRIDILPDGKVYVRNYGGSTTQYISFGGISFRLN